MPRYRKKPVIVNAFRVGLDPIPDWFMDKVTRKEATIVPASEAEAQKGPFEQKVVYFEIDTLEGVMIGNYGDYIIQGVEGEVYPCKPDIFEQTYERVDDSDTSGT